MLIKRKKKKLFNSLIIYIVFPLIRRDEPTKDQEIGLGHIALPHCTPDIVHVLLLPNKLDHASLNSKQPITVSQLLSMLQVSAGGDVFMISCHDSSEMDKRVVSPRSPTEEGLLVWLWLAAVAVDGGGGRRCRLDREPSKEASSFGADSIANAMLAPMDLHVCCMLYATMNCGGYASPSSCCTVLVAGHPCSFR